MHIHHDHVGCTCGEHNHEHEHAHSHEHTHEGHAHNHEHCHSHEHDHAHPHDHEHLHDHNHEHHHHHHDHDHDHECGCTCGSCGSKCEHTSMDELLALMQYMINHNAAHAKELADLAAQLEQAGDHAAFEQVMAAVSDFEKGNMRLSMVLFSLK